MIEKYLNENENIKRQWDLETSKKIKEHKLIVTDKRVIQFQDRKRYEHSYRDVPLKNIKYIEHEWHSRNILLLILSGVVFFITILYLIFWYRSLLLGLLTSLPLIVAAVILLIKGLKQYGYILINNDRWKFKFKSKIDRERIEFFIKEVYYLIEE